MKTFMPCCLMAALLCACSPDADNTPKIAESQREALDKAKGVQETLIQGAERTDDEIEKQSGQDE